MKEIALNSPEIEYCGRIDDRDPLHPQFIFPATYLKFRFVGSFASLKIKNQHLDWNNWHNFVGARVDGVQKCYQLNDDENTTVITLLDSEDTDKEHEILFFKRMDCHEITLEELVLSDNAKLIPYEKKPCLKMEVYGDSVSAGEVSEAVDYVGKVDPVHDGHFSNSYYSYSWMCARKLGAKLHDIAQGGIALLDKTGWFHHPDYIGMESVYDKVHYNSYINSVTTWDFSKFRPYVVVIAIGQNESHPKDFIKDEPNGEKTVLWKNTYKKFLRHLMEIYPKTHFILTTTILEHDISVDKAIDEVASDFSSPLVHRFYYSKNGCGTKGHVRISEADAMSDELAFFISTLHIDVTQEV